MPIRNQKLVNDEIYHVIAKKIEGNNLFEDTDDYFRGIFSIYEFNTKDHVIMKKRREARKKVHQDRVFLSKLGQDPVLASQTPQDSLVEILAFCLMPTHIHLLLKQIANEGISKFMNKFGAGYPAYFKKKHNKKGRGHFFQDRFVSVHIKTDEQLKIVFVYIHINPVSIIEPKWKEVGIKDPDKAIDFIENYKWSSYGDYLGKENFFPSVTKRKFLLEIMNGEQGIKEYVDNWIRYKSKIGEYKDLALE